MGQKGNSKRKRTSRMSSGRRAKSRATRTIARLMLKMNRWERYVKEIECGKRKGPVSRWNPSGIEKHISLLEKIH